jgi:hypothetical protein
LAAHQVNVLIYGGFRRFVKFSFYVSTCQGGDSDEENVEESPDEDQYDTDDPFIDDEELVNPCLSYVEMGSFNVVGSKCVNDMRWGAF